VSDAPSTRILIIDDNPAIHDDMRKIVDMDQEDAFELDQMEADLFGGATPKQRGVRKRFEIDSAYQGKEGLDLVRAALRQGRPNAVAFVDVRMPPGWDGVETIGHIWREDPTLQVVICTAYSDHSWAEIVGELGQSDSLLVLKKPFDNIEVTQMAHALSEKWRLHREAQRHLDSLESIVRERTHALEAANALLKKEIADRGRMEAELRQVQKLEALGRLAAGVGHEINNPLSFVMANISYVREELRAHLGDAGTSDEGGELVKVLDEATLGADRIKKIVQDMKLSVRADGPGGQAADLKPVVDLAIRISSHEILHRARLVTDVQDVGFVSGAAGRLEQVMVNLLVNAAQALPEGRASENEIRVSARPDGDRFVMIEVQDTGPGIPPAVMERIFDPFFTTKAVGQGTGLGLSICHGIVSELGGKITVESQGGGGTVFRVRLPVAPRPPVERERSGPLRVAAATVTPAAPVPSGRLLIVDDEPELQRALKRALRAFAPVTANSGRQAIEMMETTSFDLVLCDLMMPDLSGMDVFDQVRRAQPGAEERIVFMTGGAFTEDARDFLARVSNECILKPCDLDELRQLVRRRLQAQGPTVTAA